MKSHIFCLWCANKIPFKQINEQSIIVMSGDELLQALRIHTYGVSGSVHVLPASLPLLGEFFGET